MNDELERVFVRKVMQASTYTAIIISCPAKTFAIYTEAGIGKIIQLLLSQDKKRRPLTHDLIHAILSGLEARISQVIIHSVEEGVFFTKLFLEEERNGLKQIVEIDARPSDAIILALSNNIPIFCTQEVIQNTVAAID